MARLKVKFSEKLFFESNFEDFQLNYRIKSWAACSILFWGNDGRRRGAMLFALEKSDQNGDNKEAHHERNEFGVLELWSGELWGQDVYH